MKPLDRLLQNKKKAEVIRGRVVDVAGENLKVFLYSRRQIVEISLPSIYKKLYIPEMTLTTSDGGSVTIPKTYIRIELNELIGREVCVVNKGGKYFLLSVR